MEREDDGQFRVALEYLGGVACRAFWGVVRDTGGHIIAFVAVAVGILEAIFLAPPERGWVMTVVWVILSMVVAFVLYAIHIAAQMDREKTKAIERLKVEIGDTRRTLGVQHQAELGRAKAQEERWRRVGAELLSISLAARARPLPNGAPLRASMVMPALNRAFGRDLDTPFDAAACFRFLRSFGITSVEAFQGLLRDEILRQTVADLLRDTGQGAMRPIDLCTWGARLYLAPEDERPAVEEEIRAALERVS